jgi:hypothetical protein
VERLSRAVESSPVQVARLSVRVPCLTTAIDCASVITRTALEEKSCPKLRMRLSPEEPVSSDPHIAHVQDDSSESRSNAANPCGNERCSARLFEAQENQAEAQAHTLVPQGSLGFVRLTPTDGRDPVIPECDQQVRTNDVFFVVHHHNAL